MKIGDRVAWTSQAKGYAKKKEGIIIQVIPAQQSPFPYPKHYGGGSWRDHESYIVDCRKSPERKPDTYWPIVSKLVLLEPAK